MSDPALVDTVTGTDFATIDEIRRAALSNLPTDAADYLEGGSGEEVTLRRNRRAFAEWGLVPDLMSGRPAPSTATTFVGIGLSVPILTAPFGADGLFHPDGQVAVARANESVGTASIAPEIGTHSLEDIAGAAPRATAFGQLHPLGDETVFLDLVRRYREAGYGGLCVTCDVPVEGWRERDKGNRYLPDLQLFGGNYPNIDAALAQLGQLLRPAAAVWSWKQLGDLLATEPLPWLAKGVLTAEDAHAALDAGASGLIVSNHGGRQLDGVPASLDVLPAIRNAVGPEVPIALDSGIRTGVDIVKALALGADVVVIGRLAAYGLAAAGEAGVARVLELLRDEMLTTLTLLGRGGVTELTRDAVTRLAYT